MADSPYRWELRGGSFSLRTQAGGPCTMRLLDPDAVEYDERA